MIKVASLQLGMEIDQFQMNGGYWLSKERLLSHKWKSYI